MGIELFHHNETAYKAVTAMLAQSGKAAVIHPTGTGKSIIAYKLVEDHPEKQFCWLSPSEYIFRTQLENLRDSCGYVPERITFLTYARLMLLNPDELEAIQPDYIVLDEFHRCGAEMWGQGVQRLLDLYPKVPLLGLSATNIRYLDNQRDMADELFDGNVASEITLGEALVRGILNTPTYVTSVYAYRNALDKLEQRAQRAKTKVTRDAAERYLDALRRALEQADGLDEVFGKHMTDKSGKYIVFCVSKEHMDQMIEKAPEWFGEVDKEPHIYRAYSDDPGTEKAFSDFKQDSSGHLKLLYCINMLNEGVHVEDVSGVILFRPTISPIIYKQQIGRALSASKKTQPVIFDIVNNFENLYSIGTIQEEMEAAVTYYRSLGMEEEIVTEQFRIIDEVKDCRRLFEQLNDTLSASWNAMYACARNYFRAYGNLEVPNRYRTEEGYSLGSWIKTQRRVRAGEIQGNLTDEQIQQLNAIGMVWGSVRDLAWERNLQETRDYRECHGHLNANVNEVTESGFRIGAWLCQLRFYRKNNVQQNYLTPERIEQLNELGMVWDVPDYLWQKNYLSAMEYYLAHGNLDVPTKFVTEDGIKLGQWLRTIREVRAGKRKGVLTEEQIRLLDEIGMAWEGKFSRRWENGFTEAEKYYETFGTLDVPLEYITESGYRLGEWIRNHREGSIRITPERRKRLDAIGMIWEKEDSFSVRYRLARDYFEEHGNLDVPAGYVVEGVWLEKWLSDQRLLLRGKKTGKPMTAEQLSQMQEIGFELLGKRERAWEEKYQQVKRFVDLHGNIHIPASEKSLGKWLELQRQKAEAGKLSEEQREKLALLESTGHRSHTSRGKKQQTLRQGV